ncbi:MAG: right-handed parallel beta-helix repeat-containing protein [Bacteroidales bacterium]|nr:right-handed parallel beta-helix repeat-containing protein [Bacteroidales bacterium]
MLALCSCSRVCREVVGTADELARVLAEYRGDKVLEVILKDGIYHLQEPLVIGADLAGGITIRARHHGKAVLTKALEIPVARFTPCPEGCDPRIREESLSRIKVLDLAKECGISGLPAPDIYYSDTLFSPWIFTEGSGATPAIWPNEGWATFRDAKEIGWKKLAYPDAPASERTPASFYFEDERCARWCGESDAFITGYLYFDWRHEYVGLASCDTVDGVVALRDGTQYGVGSGGWALAERRFRIFNALSELDREGEWYIDRDRNLLYMMFPEGCESIYISVSDCPVISLDGARNVTIDGLKISRNFGSGIVGRSCSDIVITNCEICDICCRGIELEGCRNRVAGCHIHGIGQTAVHITGGDRPSLTRSDSVVEDCDIYDYGKIIATYRAGVFADGCGMTVRHNHIHHAPHMALYYGGNEHLFEFNEVDSVLLETADAGALYTGRDLGSQGTVVRYNYFHDIPAHEDDKIFTKGIYLDDNDSGEVVEWNILRNVPRALMLGGGRDNVIRNNLVIDCTIGFYMDARGVDRFDEPGWNLLSKLEANHYRESPWRERYPHLAGITEEQPELPLHDVHEGNVYVGCGDFFRYNPNLSPYLNLVNASDNIVVDFEHNPRLRHRTIEKFEGFEMVCPGGSLKDFSMEQLLEIAPHLAGIPIDSIGIRGSGSHIKIF